MRSLQLHKYRVCPHCGKELNLKKFREHKRLYYESGTKQWCKQDRMDCSTDESELSGFEFEDIDVTSNNQPETRRDLELDFDECFDEEGVNVKQILQSSMANSEGIFHCSC